MKYGTLYLLPTTLGSPDAAMLIPEGVLEVSRNLLHFIAENEKNARRYLKHIGTVHALNELQFTTLDKRSSAAEVPDICAPLLKGHDMGLISEAGMPCIADPGAIAVSWCHSKGVKVLPCSGPSSILMALIGSGFSGQHFTFHAYLPIDRKQRQHKLREMEREVAKSGYTQIFMETPFRNEQLLQDILNTCSPGTSLSIACSLSTDGELAKSITVAEWKRNQPKLHKKPCVFALGRAAFNFG